MSTIGNPIGTSLLQTAQVQQTASKMRDRERSRTEQAAQRYRDLVDLQTEAIEQTEAARALPNNESEQHEYEHTSHAMPEIPVGVDEAEPDDASDNESHASRSPGTVVQNNINAYVAPDDDRDSHIDFTA